MRYQANEKPSGNSADIFSEDHTDSHSAANSQKKELKPATKWLRILIAVVLCVMFFGAGKYLGSRDRNPFLKSAKPGYLSLNDYVLTDTDGSPVQKSSVSEFQDKYTFTFSFDVYTTSRGISVGDSWSKFVNAYGDTYAYEITCDDVKLETDRPLTISEFQKMYVDTGKIDPNVTEIEIEFMTGTDGSNLCYTENDLQRALDQLEQTPSLLKRMDSDNSRIGRFTLSFVFTPTFEGSAVDFIYSGFRQA